MDLLQRIEESVKTDNLSGHLQWFSQVRRDTGGPGEDAACDYIVNKLKEYGVPYRVHEFDAFLSYPREASLEVLAPEPLTIPCLTHSFCQSTAPEGLTGELTFIADGDATATGGKIALLDGLLAPIKVLQASRAGAQALIFANEDRVIHNMIGTTIWGTPGLDQLDRLPTIPAVSINREGGEQLKRLLASGPVTVRIKTKVDTGWYRSRMPEALIEGTGDTEKFVLVGGHYCSWEVGITDNATGDAVLLEMARVLQQHRGELKRNVRIVWWTGHSHGRYSGSTWYADNFFTELAENCITYHNIDSPGVRGATRYVARHTTAEIQDFCRQAIGRLTGQYEAEINRPSRAADQSFLAMGVPAFSCYPFLPVDHPDYRPWTGGCANAYWWHSSEDTLDKADVDILTLDTKISSTAVATLCTAPVLPLNANSVAHEVTEFAAQLQQQATGHFDVSGFVADAEQLKAAAADLMASIPAAPTAAQAQIVNDALMGLSRIIGPVIYSKGGRFTHDPAEWSPLMRNTKSSTFPGLAPAQALEGLRGTDHYGFLRAQLVRELNRVRMAVREAVTHCREASRALA